MASKRLVKLCVACSIDGYIAGPKEEIDWLHDPKDFDFKSFFDSTDCILMGRKTYDFSVRMGHGASMGKKAYVFTRAETPPDDPSVEFVSGDVREFVETLRSQPGRDIWLMGGGELAQSFFAERLIDEIILGLHPIVLGGGIPLFPGLHDRITYELVSCETHPRGLLGLTYRMLPLD